MNQVWKKAVMTGAAVAGLTACAQSYDFAIPSDSNDFIQGVAYNNKVDVVFVMDNSSGMDVGTENAESALQRLRKSIPTLVGALLAQKLDLHVSVITTSMGGDLPNGGVFLGSPKYFTNATPNLAGAISQRLNEVGNNGSDLERGFDSLYAVVSDGYRAGGGAGFHRDDALLAIIALSSEDDHSALSVSSLANRLDTVKGFYDDGKRRWTMNFIGITSLSGSCPTNPGSNYKEPGTKWMDGASLSGGVVESLCAADLSNAASNIKKRIAQILTDFRLASTPNLATLTVRVNGVLVPRNSTNGWDYLPATNVVRFYGSAIPAADASIKIDFVPASAN